MVPALGLDEFARVGILVDLNRPSFTSALLGHSALSGGERTVDQEC